MSGRRRAAQSAQQSRWTQLVSRATVISLLVGGIGGFSLLHETVVLEVDGSTQVVEGYSRTVGELLAANQIAVDELDLVMPALEEPVPDAVVVRHARQVTFTVDGVSQTVWTTAGSVEDAVAELGLRGQEMRLSASRGDALGRGLNVSTTKRVHVVVDGNTIDSVTTAGTVRDALRDVGIVLGPGDQLSVPLDATAVNGLVVAVTRAEIAGETRTESVPYESQTVEDSALPQGMTVVISKGRAGVRTVTYEVQVVGGAVVGRTQVLSVLTRAPVNEVIHLGTGSVPTVTPGSAQSIAQAMLPSWGWGDDEFSCLVALWNRESGWRVNAENSSSGAYGIPQALPGSKMASAGADWRTNPATQITWGLGYVQGRYGTPCGAWAFFQSHNWY